MKTRFITACMISSFLIISSALLAQGPPDPPEDPGDGGGPVGGAAPIGNGIGILLALGAAYGGKKIYNKLVSDKNDLEE
jgi:hypothetical protein